jgi:hypothetical protein
MAFMFKLEDEDGEPADPLQSLRLRLEGWRPIYLSRRTLRVGDVRASEDPEENAVLIVHDTDKQMTLKGRWRLRRTPASPFGSAEVTVPVAPLPL